MKPLHIKDTFKNLMDTHLPDDSLRGRMAKGTFWSLCGTLALQASALLTSILNARILDAGGFGEFNLLRSTILMFGVLAGSGLGVLATKYVAEYRNKEPEVAGDRLSFLIRVAYFIGTFGTLVCALLASPIAIVTMKSPSLVVPILIGSALLLLNAIYGIQIGTLCGLEAFRTVSRLMVFDAFFNLVFIPIGAFLWGVPGAIGGTVLASAAGFPMRQLAMVRGCQRNHIPLHYRKDTKHFFEMFQTIVPSLLLGIAFYPFEWLAKLFIVRHPHGFSQLGIFAAAYSFGTMIAFVPNQLMSTSQSLFGNLFGKKDTQSIREFAVFNVALSGGSALLVALVIGLGSNYLMGAFGRNFSNAGSVLAILSCANVFFALLIPYHRIAVTHNRLWAQTFFSAFAGLSLVTAAFFLVDKGAFGLAVSYLIAWFLMFTVESGFIWKLFKNH